MKQTIKSFRRIILKITGESLSGVGAKGLSEEHIEQLGEKLIKAAKSGFEIAVVVGGGNILRGANLSKSRNIRQFASHQMGMIATTINGLAMVETLRAMKQDASVYSAFNVGTIVPQYSVSQAQSDLADGKIVVLAGGTGNPYVTTDTCAAIRAAELGADAIFKATKVDGVYAEDPMKNPKAKRFETMTFDECINRRIGVIDLTAVQICQQANVPIVIFHFDNLDRLKELVAGKKPYSIISR